MRRDSQESAGRTAGRGRMGVRPGAVTRSEEPVQPGKAVTLDMNGGGHGALLYVPAGYDRERPAPLAVMLHGAGGNASHGLRLLADVADTHGLLLLAPASRGGTWDVIGGQYGPDVALIDRALRETFARCAVDPARLAVGGFSDGGSYALSLGLTNGDLFTHVVALSPGFMAAAARQGRPRIFVSHGTRDETLPIAVCSRRLVPALRQAGYDVTYQEFEGPHTVPPRIAALAADWFLGG